MEPCIISADCLLCQMPECKYDSPDVGSAANSYLARKRDAEILLLYRAAPGPATLAKAELVAGSLGITPRTVYRALERERKREGR